MEDIKKARKILKSLGEDTRLRIINLLHIRYMNVSELSQVLDATQPSISKHLTRLRLTGIVNEEREGQFTNYHLIKSDDKFQRDLINTIIKKLSDSKTAKEDIEKLKKLDS
ncbi:MAG: metalloregulator ArsR/SmtB family transcription factor [Spirochaetota bacterium]|nr:metalloregulator ArsR/SmtB family transcription factor [Spirochaetota bacterium]